MRATHALAALLPMGRCRPVARAVYARPVPPRPRALPEGVYEHVVTEALSRALDATTLARELEPLGDEDAPAALGRLVAREVERALAALAAAARAERARALADALLDQLAALAPADDAAAILDQRVPAPAQRLLALHRGAVPIRPETPLTTSTLLTRSPREPSFGHELARELATADRVDAIVAFVTLGGVRALLDALHQFARRSGSTTVRPTDRPSRTSTRTSSRAAPATSPTRAAAFAG